MFKLVDDEGNTMMKFDPTDDIGHLVDLFRMSITSYIMSKMDNDDFREENNQDRGGRHANANQNMFARQRNDINQRDLKNMEKTVNDFNLSDDSDDEERKPKVQEKEGNYEISQKGQTIGCVMASSFKQASKMARDTYFRQKFDIKFKITFNDESKKYHLDDEGSVYEYE